jgi:hypothetical protein
MEDDPRSQDGAPPTELRRHSRLPWIVLAVAVAAAGAYAVLRFHGGAEDRGASSTSPEAAPAEPAPPPAVQPAESERPVDAAGAKALLEGVSKNALFRRWLAEANLIRRCVQAVDDVADGVSPRIPLASLGPASPFSVAQRGEGFVIAPESYARFDAVTDAIDSIDAQALASAYRRLHGVLESAYRALGYPAGSIDRTTARALLRIENAPVAKGDVPVEGQGGVWVFADSKQEQLRDVEKHLLRMGPGNTLRVQAKARQIREALRLPPQVASGAR